MDRDLVLIWHKDGEWNENERRTRSSQRGRNVIKIVCDWRGKIERKINFPFGGRGQKIQRILGLFLSGSWGGTGFKSPFLSLPETLHIDPASQSCV